jgi:hypothetical protein
MKATCLANSEMDRLEATASYRTRQHRIKVSFYQWSMPKQKSWLTLRLSASGRVPAKFNLQTCIMARLSQKWRIHSFSTGTESSIHLSLSRHKHSKASCTFLSSRIRPTWQHTIYKRSPFKNRTSRVFTSARDGSLSTWSKNSSSVLRRAS